MGSYLWFFSRIEILLVYVLGSNVGIEEDGLKGRGFGSLSSVNGEVVEFREI